MPKISVYDLMTINRILLLIIDQNDINPKLLQPIVASICKVMTVKKPCVLSKLTKSTYGITKHLQNLNDFDNVEKCGQYIDSLIDASTL